MLFLIARTFGVSLYSSMVYDESRRPIEKIRDVPKHEWNGETERLLEQMRADKCALSGMKYFYLTRPLILKVNIPIVVDVIVFHNIFTINYTKLTIISSCTYNL